jgi:hypothetical protein
MLTSAPLPIASTLFSSGGTTSWGVKFKRSSDGSVGGCCMSSEMLGKRGTDASSLANV